MLKVILARLTQGYRTIKYPKGTLPVLPALFRGVPVFDSLKCVEGCTKCEDICPTHAISTHGGWSIDIGRCLFCMDCVTACPQNALTHSKDFRLAVRDRKDFFLTQDARVLKLAAALDKKMKNLFGRSLMLRQVSAGGCNACEADINVLTTIGWDLGRFGIKFVASPRHADGLLITGPVTRNMELALKKAWDAIPEPKLVIVVGACAISGGPFIDHSQANNGVNGIVPVDLFIPGCPPHPLTILDGLLRLLGRIKE